VGVITTKAECRTSCLFEWLPQARHTKHRRSPRERFPLSTPLDPFYFSATTRSRSLSSAPFYFPLFPQSTKCSHFSSCSRF